MKNLQRPHCIVWGRPWRLKIGATCQQGPNPQRYGDTVRQRGGGKLDSLTAFFSRPTAAPEARRCQFSRISGAVGRAFTLVELRIVPWKIPWVECPRDPVRPHDGPCWVTQKRRAREEEKRRKKRAVRVSPTIEFDEEMETSWDCHRNSSSDSSDVESRMRSVGSQELMGCGFDRTHIEA